MALESVLISAVVEVAEGRDVAVTDIPGTYLSAEMDDVLHMVLEGRLAKLMVIAVPEVYRNYITYDKKKASMLCLRLVKALYGCLKSALLFYQKLSTDQVKYGFKINPYDLCVANKHVDGSQLTVTWHVDDLKVSHEKEEVVTSFLR